MKVCELCVQCQAEFWHQNVVYMEPNKISAPLIAYKHALSSGPFLGGGGGEGGRGVNKSLANQCIPEKCCQDQP